MPTSTEARIEELCARVRALTDQRFSPETETELRKIAKELRAAIGLHVQMAKVSLGQKRAAIVQRDPDEE